MSGLAFSAGEVSERENRLEGETLLVLSLVKASQKPLKEFVWPMIEHHVLLCR
jgi:hypothetical protein